LCLEPFIQNPFDKKYTENPPIWDFWQLSGVVLSSMARNLFYLSTFGSKTCPDYFQTKNNTESSSYWSSGYLPSFISSSVIGVVLGDVGVDARKGQLFVDGLRYCLHDQLGIAEGWLGLVLKNNVTCESVTNTLK